MVLLEKMNRFLRKPEGFFAVVALLFGGILLVVIPPIQTPDEMAHFLRIYQISQFELTPSAHGSALGGELPRSLNKTIELLDTHPSLRFHADVKYDIHKTAAALHIPLNKQDKTFISGLTSYSPFSYIPQALGVSIGSLFNLSPIVLMYIARLASLFTWVGLLFLTIKVMPFKKWAFVGIGLLPMLIAQAVSPGIDAISVGLGALYIAVVFKYKTQAEIAFKEWILLLLLGCLVALMKQTTIVVIGLVFVLKTSQFDVKKWKSMIKKTLAIGLPILVLAIWSIMVNKLNIGGSSGIAGQDGPAQIHYLLHHPLHFVQVLFNTFFTTWGDSIIGSFVGGFGWADTPLAAGFVNMGYIFIACMIFVNYEPVKKVLSSVHKYAITLFIALFILGTCGALYVYYTPVDYPVIYGLQGRYFLLFLFMAIPLFTTFNLRMTQKSYIKLVSFGSVSLLFVSLITIYLRYYVKLF